MGEWFQLCAKDSREGSSRKLLRWLLKTTFSHIHPCQLLWVQLDPHNKPLIIDFFLLDRILRVRLFKRGPIVATTNSSVLTGSSLIRGIIHARFYIIRSRAHTPIVVSEYNGVFFIPTYISIGIMYPSPQVQRDIGYTSSIFVTGKYVPQLFICEGQYGKLSRAHS